MPSRKITCVRRFQFCAGHRVVQHESKCAHIHGHNYVAFVHAESEALDAVGRVIDFSVIKEAVGDWINKYWDHGLILFSKDPYLPSLASLENENSERQKLFVMEQNPTAENMAQDLFRAASLLLMPYDVKITKVVLWETENCYATYEERE